MQFGKYGPSNKFYNICLLCKGDGQSIYGKGKCEECKGRGKVLSPKGKELVEFLNQVGVPAAWKE